MATSLESLTECSICTHIFREPVSLSCDHNFCKSCVRKLTKNNKVVCPVCKKVTEKQTVKPDFRLAQFLDALAEQAKQLTTTKVEVKEESDATKHAAYVKSDITLCDLCSKLKISYECEDCRCWLCDHCASGHLKIPFCKNHKIVSLDQKNKETIENLNIEFGELDHDVNEHKKLVFKAEQNISTAAKLKKKLYKATDELMREIVNDISSHFNNMKENISDNIQHNIDRNEKDKEKIEKQLESLITHRDVVNKLLQENSCEIAIHTAPILEEAKDLRSRSSISEYNLTRADIVLEKANDFDIRRSATLNFRSNGYITIAKKDWKQSKKVDIESRVRASRVFGDLLYCCCDDGIWIFDDNLDLQRKIQIEGIHRVYDIAALPSGELAVASRDGLFLFNLHSNKLQTIANGKFTSVQFYNEQLCAAEGSTHAIQVFAMFKGWEKIKEFGLPCKDHHVLYITVKRNILFASCEVSGKIWSMPVDKDESNVTLIDTLCGRPFLCNSDETGLMLIEIDNFKVVILDELGVHYSKQFEVEQSIMFRWAVYWNGNLYFNKLPYGSVNILSSIEVYKVK